MISNESNEKEEEVERMEQSVTFGSLGTYNGIVEYLIRNNQNSTASEKYRNVVAMVNVGVEYIPEGILSFSRTHKQNILHVRILLQCPTNDTTSSTSAPCEKHKEKHYDSLLDYDEEYKASQMQQRRYLVLFELSNVKSAELFVTLLNNKPFTSLSPNDKCQLYPVTNLKSNGISLLNPFFKSEQQNNCPVCLEEIDNEPELITTICNHTFHIDCLLQCLDSPCPVCRYDHSGLNDTLSQCHVCGSTSDNYVCLICGVISCGSSDSCRRRGGHAKEHYRQTLHAYALEIETQHVWDFAGDGFVHRLIQNKDDGKLVEITDPNNTSEERSRVPALTDEQENEVVHVKLEQFANQYYTLLKSQLEQQRIYYEAKLTELKRQHEKTAQNSYEDFITALKQEKQSLQKRAMTIQRKYTKVQKDVEFLKNMNESLVDNKQRMERQIQDATDNREQARLVTLRDIQPLEDKVAKLMEMFDEGFSNDHHKKKPACNRKR